MNKIKQVAIDRAQEKEALTYLRGGPPLKPPPPLPTRAEKEVAMLARTRKLVAREEAAGKGVQALVPQGGGREPPPLPLVPRDRGHQLLTRRHRVALAKGGPG